MRASRPLQSFVGGCRPPNARRTAGFLREQHVPQVLARSISHNERRPSSFSEFITPTVVCGCAMMPVVVSVCGLQCDPVQPPSRVDFYVTLCRSAIIAWGTRLMTPHVSVSTEVHVSLGYVGSFCPLKS